MRRARDHGAAVAVSIYVNRRSSVRGRICINTRGLERLALCGQEFVDVVFARPMRNVSVRTGADEAGFQNFDWVEDWR